jgi:hypothetical protein
MLLEWFRTSILAPNSASTNIEGLPPTRQDDLDPVSLDQNPGSLDNEQEARWTHTSPPPR